MVKVFPFRGLRPISEKAAEIASPPYDVLNAQEAKTIVKEYPNSFLRINKAECEYDDGTDPHSETVYKKAKENLFLFIKNGLMIQDEQPCFYIYRLTINNQCQTGLCCVMSIEDYNNGIIKKHEYTRPDKVEDRANHIEYLEAQVGPVFSIFRNNSDISDLFEQLTQMSPETSFTSDDGVTHDFWVIKDQSIIKVIQKRFNTLSCTYIADGHHRSESAAEVVRRKNNTEKLPEPYNYFLHVLFPDDEVNILPYNRIARKPEDLSVQEVLDRAEFNFNLAINKEGAFSPEAFHTYGVYIGGNWYRMTLINNQLNEDDPVKGIDAEILQQYFIGTILNIKDPKTDERIQFVGGIRGNTELENRVDSGEFDIAFSLYPTTVSQLLNVADAQKVMPPKSTWFEPKLRSGMVVHLLTNL
ncbi:MAG: DUF1015 family protein [Candidatus Marinimicrobia bacterium]|nr:DUF1015 family protein [Candidatus Neomarinimicrobiota bacterium]HJM46474.1 DUF1015 family protein [Candidatus Neomarinimicrobiota bacterium]